MWRPGAGIGAPPNTWTSWHPPASSAARCTGRRWTSTWSSAGSSKTNWGENLVNLLLTPRCAEVAAVQRRAGRSALPREERARLGRLHDEEANADQSEEGQVLPLMTRPVRLTPAGPEDYHYTLMHRDPR